MIAYFKIYTLTANLERLLSGSVFAIFSLNKFLIVWYCNRFKDLPKGLVRK